MTPERAYRVRAIRCSHKASQAEIYERLKAITAPLARSWDKLEEARTIGIKANIQMRPDRIRRIGGRRQELVDPDVLWAAVGLLRERTDAHIFVIDSSEAPAGRRPGSDFNTRPVFEEFGIPYVEAGDPPFECYEVPGGGLMFRKYQLAAAVGQADAFVSIAKMKSHAFMGVTLCLKNLFGLPPMPPHGRVRSYFHHVIRLSYVLPDLGLIVRPCLNIIDGLTGQSKREWGGVGRICNALVAGDHVIATDACGAYLMGADPAADWPHPPYRRDRSPIAVAAEHGFGTVNLEDIDFEMEDLSRPLAEFDSVEMDANERITNLRHTACQQALFYRDHHDHLVERYGGSFIYLQDAEVIWSGAHPEEAGPPQELSGRSKDQAVWLKFVDPDENEGEHFGVYERILDAGQMVPTLMPPTPSERASP